MTDKGESVLQPHPMWTRSWHVRNEPLGLQNGFSVQAIDASGALFGFGVSAGWPELAEQMAHALLAVLVKPTSSGYTTGPSDIGRQVAALERIAVTLERLANASALDETLKPTEEDRT